MISASGGGKCPVGVHTPLPASSTNPWCTRSAIQGSDEWAVSLRAAQLIAEDSLTGRRSVAPLRVLLAFGEIVHRRLRVSAERSPSINRVDNPFTRAAPWGLTRVDSPSVIMHRRASTTSPP